LVTDYYGAGGKVRHDNKQSLIAVKCVACPAKRNVELSFFSKHGVTCIRCGAKMHAA